MRLNILIGGRAGQGINIISEIVSKTITSQGYFIFNYRDYPSLIRGGHNFNILSISDEKIESHESKLDGIVAMDQDTIDIHKKELKKDGFIIDSKRFIDLKKDINLALSGALIKILGSDKKILIQEIKKKFNNKNSLEAVEKGYINQKDKFKLKRLKNKLEIMSGSRAIAKGAINSKINIYFAYPMTPSTGVLHELASKQIENNYLVFQNLIFFLQKLFFSIYQMLQYLREHCPY